jgi:hypothetical protein
MANDPRLVKRALPVARHECGHYVIARVLGFAVEGPRLQLHISGGHIGQSEIALQMSAKSTEEVLRYAEGRAKVLAAGVLAESLEGGRVNNTRALNLFKDTGASQDYAKYREAIYLIRNIKYEVADEKQMQLELTDIDAQLWNDAINMIHAEHGLIEQLASVLANKVTLVDQFVSLNPAEIGALLIVT